MSDSIILARRNVSGAYAANPVNKSLFVGVQS